MEKKYLVASHGELAKGIQSSLNILAEKGDSITAINAYMTEEDYTPIITEFVASIKDDEQAIIFTDLFGGSVNQKVVTEVLTAGKENIFVVSNANLAVVLSTMFLPEDQPITKEQLENTINESQVCLVPTTIEEDEEDIF
ncbi:PTS sugar transporter subunit IIA domain-containing protein [Vagococcus silagei]|uniref:PTS mannose transporter subunit IIA n=1 Tax=Vagococcus silagei TaxID=2508885 RepID=A0A4S3B6Q3_9ENTE|nr:PTS mannose transporter subunit IIA [Vagococcus silagei]THB60335.1 PTS mannose transporter subunit IIA [Vagococcus silagei]